MKNLLNKINCYLKTNYTSIVELLNDHSNLINETNRLQMFVSSKSKEILETIQSELNSFNLTILGNINCPIDEYENDIEDDGFELELEFNGKYEFKPMPIGYDAITKLFFFYFYPTNEKIDKFSTFYKQVFDKLITKEIEYLLVDDYGYIDGKLEDRNFVINVNIDFQSIEDLINSVYLLSCIDMDVNINYINE